MPSASATLPASTRADSFRGVLAGCSAHALWGVAVLYWRLLAELPAVSILAHRMAWSCLFVLAVTVMGEAIKPGDMVTFPLIWSALALYTWDALRSMRRLKAENAARFAARAEAVDESPLS